MKIQDYAKHVMMVSIYQAQKEKYTLMTTKNRLLNLLSDFIN